VTRIALPDPPTVAWPLLFEMNAIPRTGYGPGWSHFDAGMVVIMRHTQDKQIIGRGKVALLEWLGM
jgi:hypothetical protein